MHAVHSSSVLACNVFDYWRAKDLGLMGQALGIESLIERITFEAQFPTGLPGSPPNLDVACGSGWVTCGLLNPSSLNPSATRSVALRLRTSTFPAVDLSGAA